MSQVFTEPKHLGDLLKFEAENLFSRDAVEAAAGEVLSIGSVVGRVSSNRQIKAFDPSATDGTETPVGVLINPVNSPALPVPSVLIARHAALAEPAVVWPASISVSDKAQATAQLQALGILIREGA